MKLKSFALGLALGVLGAVSMLLVTYYPELSNAVLGETKGLMLRSFMVDTYPGYDPYTALGVVLGVVYGFLDGLIFGVILGGIYNLFNRNGN